MTHGGRSRVAEECSIPATVSMTCSCGQLINGHSFNPYLFFLFDLCQFFFFFVFLAVVFFVCVFC